MSETPDELRKRLKEEHARKQSANTNEPVAGGSSSPTINATGRDIELYAPNIPNTDGYGVQSVSGQSDGVVGIVRATRNAERKLADRFRSATQSNSGDGYDSGRHGEDSRQSRSDGTHVSTSPERPIGRSKLIRTAGNLETYDEIPERNFTENYDTQGETATSQPEVEGTPQPRKRGRPRKQGIPGTVQIPTIDKATIEPTREIKQRKKFLNGVTLSKKEAEDLEEPLIAALTDEFAMLDKALWKYAQDELEQPIWSDITEKEMQSFVNILLKLGQKSPVVASGVRVAVDGSDYVVAVGLVAPRFQTTVDIVRKVRKTKREQNRNAYSTLQRLRASRNRNSSE